MANIQVIFGSVFPEYRQYPGIYASNFWILSAHKSSLYNDIFERWNIGLIIFEILPSKIYIFLKTLCAAEFLETLRFDSECYLI